MGNSPPTGLRLSTGDADRSCQVQLGDSAAIVRFHGKEVISGKEGTTERWGVAYKVGDVSCRHYLSLKRQGNTDSHEFIEIKTRPDNGAYWYSTRVRKAGADLLRVVSSNAFGSFDGSSESGGERRTFLTTNAWGGITETFLKVHESGIARGLLICEWKKKTSVDKPYMGTWTHYYVHKDVGLSVAVKRIRVKDGRFEFVVDGPHQHPVHALLYMFEEVRRTGIWKLTYCPHCATSVIQTHRRSDAEDSDVDNAPSAPLRGGRGQGLGALLGNGSNFTGDHNGKVEIQNYYAGGGWLCPHNHV